MRLESEHTRYRTRFKLHGHSNVTVHTSASGASQQAAAHEVSERNERGAAC